MDVMDPLNEPGVTPEYGTELAMIDNEDENLDLDFGLSVNNDDVLIKKKHPISFIAHLMRKFVAVINLQPFSKARIYLDVLDILIIIGLIGFNVAIFFSNCLGHSPCWQSSKKLGQEIGTLLQYNFILVLVPICKRSTLLSYIGIPFNRVLIYHRWMGRWAFVLLMAHAIVLTYFFYVGHGGWSGIWKEYTKAEIIWGEIAGLFMCIITFSSLPIFRRRLYELFMKTHYISFICALAFACFHKHGSTLALIISGPLVLYVIDLTLRFMFLALNAHTIKSVVPIGGKHVELTINKYKRYKAGDYVYVYIPSVSLFQMHPFSPVSSPDTSDNLVLAISSSGNWSKRLLANRDKLPSCRVFIDGPYTANTIPALSYHHLILVAGGIGITPLLSILKQIDHANRTNLHTPTRILLVWSSRDSDIFSHYAEEIGALAHHNPAIMLRLFYSGPEDSFTQPLEMSGFSPRFYEELAMNRANLESVIDDYVSTEARTGWHNIGVMVCGSSTLQHAVSRIVSLPRKHCFFTLHRESFKV